MSKPTLFNWLSLMFLGIIWGGSFMGAKVALSELPPMTIAFSRLIIGATILLAFTLATGRKFPDFHSPTGRRIWLHMAIMGLITNAIPFTLLNWGQLYVSSGFAGVTMAVVPLLVLPLTHFFIKGGEMTQRKSLGFAIGFIGIVFLIGPKEIIQGTGESWEGVARIACITAACCYALGTINTRLCPPVSTMAFSTGGLIIGAIIMLPLTLYFEGIQTQLPSSNVVISTLFLGIFPTALATILLVGVINSAGPAFMSLVNYQVPLWAIVFGVVFLGEAIPASFIGAFILILIGLAISQSKGRGTDLPRPNK